VSLVVVDLHELEDGAGGEAGPFRCTVLPAAAAIAIVGPSIVVPAAFCRV